MNFCLYTQCEFEPECCFQSARRDLKVFSWPLQQMTFYNAFSDSTSCLFLRGTPICPMKLALNWVSARIPRNVIVLDVEFLVKEVGLGVGDWLLTGWAIHRNPRIPQIHCNFNPAKEGSWAQFLRRHRVWWCWHARTSCLWWKCCPTFPKSSRSDQIVLRTNRNWKFDTQVIQEIAP